MSIPLSVSRKIKVRLKEKIGALDTVQVVYGAQVPVVSGWPAAFVTTGSLDGEFSSNAENSRVYGFDVLVAFPIGQDTAGQNEEERYEYVEGVISKVLDDIVNTMDTDFELEDSDATVLYVQPADATWGGYEYDGGIAIAAQITLKVYTEITIQ